MPAEHFLDALPDVLVGCRLDALVAQLLVARPGRRSRRIYALAMERALADGKALRRVLAAVTSLTPDPLFLRPGAPPAETQRRLNTAMTRPLRRADR